MYGTLLTGEDNHAEMADARRLGATRTLPGYALLDMGAWPALVHGCAAARPGRADEGVFGELYAVTPAHLFALDAFEDCPELYLRCGVALACGTPAEAYFLQPRQARGLPLLHPPRWPTHAAARRRSRLGP